MNEKIELKDSLMDIIMKLSGGNPDAIRVCMELYTHGGNIDSDAAMGGLASLLSLDTLNVYRERIWMLYKDVCCESIVKTVGMLRGWQLGYISEDKLNIAIDNRGDGIDVDKIMDMVCERLKNFDRNFKI